MGRFWFYPRNTFIRKIATSIWMKVMFPDSRFHTNFHFPNTSFQMHKLKAYISFYIINISRSGSIGPQFHNENSWTKLRVTIFISLDVIFILSSIKIPIILTPKKSQSHSFLIFKSISGPLIHSSNPQCTAVRAGFTYNSPYFLSSPNFMYVKFLDKLGSC